MVSRDLARELLALAIPTALEAGALLASRFADGPTQVGTKSSATDMVSEVDHESEALIVSRLLAARPGDAILGEEGGVREGESGVRWVIDPLDGTTNYLYGYPAFCVSIAAEFEGETLAAAVYDPLREELFAAAAGEGATLNAVPIVVRQGAVLETALVATGFGYTPERRTAQVNALARVLPHIRDIRRGGSAALDLCSVACGRVDAYYEQGIQHWDMAAGELIAREAGALTGFEPAGFEPPAFVVAPPSLFEPLKALLRSATERR